MFGSSPKKGVFEPNTQLGLSPPVPLLCDSLFEPRLNESSAESVIGVIEETLQLSKEYQSTNQFHPNQVDYVVVNFFHMVNAIKGMLISCDVPMAVFIVNMNAALPQSQKFIVHVLDSTHIFVLSDVAGMIRSAIAEFREANTYEKPAA